MFIIKVILFLIIQNYLNDATSTTHYLVQDGKIQAQVFYNFWFISLFWSLLVSKKVFYRFWKKNLRLCL